MDIWSKLTCIENSFFILLYGYLLARTTGTWSHPAVIYAVFWFAMTFLPLVAVFTAPVDPWATFYILGTVIAFGLPALCYDWSESVAIAKARQFEPQSAASFDFLLAIFFGMQIFVILFVFVNLHLQGFSPAEFIANPMAAAHRYLSARYNGLVTSNPFSQAGVVLNYIAVAIGGMLIVLQTVRVRAAAVALFAFTPSLLYLTIYADKGTLFQSAAYFFGGVIVGRIARGDLSLLNKGTIKIGAIAGAMLVPILIFSMISRGGDVVFYLRSYAFGHLYAFSNWFQEYYFAAIPSSTYDNPGDYTNGFWTFLTIGQTILPGHSIPLGYFAEYFKIPDVIQSNIYTMFRGLIYDFGLVGSLVFMASAGFTASIAYNAILRNKALPLSQSFFILTVGCIYSSYLFSLLAWNSAYAAAFGVLALLFANDLRTEWNRLVRT